VKRGEWTTTERLPVETQGILGPGELMTIPPFSPVMPGDALHLVFHGELGGEGPATTGAEAVAVREVDPTRLCTRKLWQWGESGALVAYDLGPNGLPSGSAVPVVPDLFPGGGHGIAYDPTDRGLWFVQADDGFIWKMTQTGEVVASRFVSPTMTKEDGSAQLDFSALGMDPDDPHFIWVSGFTSFSLDWIAVYKVETSTGLVVHTCGVRRNDAPISTSAANNLLAVGLIPGGTTFVAAPGQDWKGNRLFGWRTASCAGAGVWDLFEPPPGELFRYPTGVEINGRGQLLAVIVELSGARTFYNFGFLLPGAFNLATPMASAPAERDGDIAIGSDF
jgi:hypothetical protein